MEYSEQVFIQKSARQTFSGIGLACFVILITSTVLQYAAVLLTRRFAPAWTDQAWFFWAAAFIPLYTIAIPTGITLFRRIPAEHIETRKLRFRDLLVFLVMCFPIMYIGNITGTLISNALHTLLGTEIKNPLDALLRDSNIWLATFVLVILAPVIEEFIFRRLIIDRLRPYGESAGVFISALLFGLFHGNLNQFFYAFGLGALFAFIYIKTGRLRYTIFLHMVINLLGGVLAPLLLKGLDLNSLTQMNPGTIISFVSEHLPQLIALVLYSLLYFSLAITGLILLIVRRSAFYLGQGPILTGRGTGFKTMFLNPGMALFTAAALALFVLSLM